MRKREQEKEGRQYKAYLDPFIFGIIALTAFLIFTHFEISTTLAEQRKTVQCHLSALNASESLDENINDVEYYEFLFKTCMRESGYAL